MKKYIDNKLLLLFFSKLELVIDSDVSLFEGLGFALEKEKDERLAGYYKAIMERSIEGESLSSILGDLNFIENKRYIKLIELGEHTGSLDSVLKDIIEDIEMEIFVSERIKVAVNYPSMLFYLTIAVIYIIILKVVPMFKNIILYNNVKVGKSTNFVFMLSDFVNNNLILSSVILVAFVGLVVLLFNSNFKYGFGKKMFSSMLMTSNIQRTRMGLNFARSYLLLVKSGLGAEQSFEFLAASEGAKEISDKYKKAKEIIETQQDYNKAYNLLDFLPESLIQIIAVSSRTGHTEKALEKIIKVLKRDLESYIERFISKIEPTMIFIVTLIVGIVLFSVVSPVFNMIGSMV